MTPSREAVEKIEKLSDWMRVELDSFFQGEFGTMDDTLEMFIDSTLETVKDLITTATLQAKKEERKKVRKIINKQVGRTPNGNGIMIPDAFNIEKKWKAKWIDRNELIKDISLDSSQ